MKDLLDRMLEDTMDGYSACEKLVALGPEAIEQAIVRAERAKAAGGEVGAKVSRAQINLSGALCKRAGDAAEPISRQFFGDERHWHIAMFAHSKEHASKFMRAVAAEVRPPAAESGGILAVRLRPGVTMKHPRKKGARVRVDSAATKEGFTTIEYTELRKDGSLTTREGFTTVREFERVRVFPSATPGMSPGDTNDAAPTGTARGEADMATVTRKSATKGGKKATGAKAATNGKPKSSGRAKFAPTKAEVTAIAKRLREGTKMNELKAELGLSNGQPIRNALLEHGFDSKGNKNPEGLSAREVRARNAAAKKSAAKKSGGSKAGR